MCDLCDYTCPSNKGIKMHWTRKHRRVVEEDEARKKGEMVLPENDKKRSRENEESTDSEAEETKKYKNSKDEPLDESRLAKYDYSDFESDSEEEEVEAKEKKKKCQVPTYIGLSQEQTTQNSQELMVIDRENEAEKVVINSATGQIGGLGDAVQSIAYLEDENRPK